MLYLIYAGYVVANLLIMSAAISYLKFPFHLKGHQLEAVDAWISSGMRGSIIYSSGTGKTEIAFECARRAADITPNNAEHQFRLLMILHSIFFYLFHVLS